MWKFSSILFCFLSSRYAYLFLASFWFWITGHPTSFFQGISSISEQIALMIGASQMSLNCWLCKNTWLVFVAFPGWWWRSWGGQWSLLAHIFISLTGSIRRGLFGFFFFCTFTNHIFHHYGLSPCVEAIYACWSSKYIVSILYNFYLWQNASNKDKLYYNTNHNNCV